MRFPSFSIFTATWLDTDLGLSVVLLISYFRTKNAVWGGFTGGIIVGVIIALFGEGFNWFILGKTAIIGTIVGFAADLLGKIADHIKRK